MRKINSKIRYRICFHLYEKCVLSTRLNIRKENVSMDLYCTLYAISDGWACDEWIHHRRINKHRAFYVALQTWEPTKILSGKEKENNVFLLNYIYPFVVDIIYAQCISTARTIRSACHIRFRNLLTPIVLRFTRMVHTRSLYHSVCTLNAETASRSSYWSSPDDFLAQFWVLVHKKFI